VGYYSWLAPKPNTKPPPASANSRYVLYFLVHSRLYDLLLRTSHQSASGDDEHKRKLDQITDLLQTRLPEPKRRRGPSPPKPDAALSESDENEPDEYLTTTMKVLADEEIKALLTLVDTGSPKSFLIAKCAEILFPTTDLKKRHIKGSIWNCSLCWLDFGYYQ